MAPARGDVLGEDHLTALVGDGARRYAAAGATIVLGETGSAIVAEPADSQTLSCAWNALDFRLLRSPEEPLPSELLARKREALPIHVVARLAGGDTYLGRARHSMSSRAGGELEHCRLRFAAPLSFELLDLVRPPAATPDVAGVEWLAQVAIDRAAALEAFIVGWHGDADPEAADPPRVPARTPAALADFHRLAHGRPAVLGRLNYVLPADELSTNESDGSLFFASENQSSFIWALDPDADDPTVWTVEEVEEVAEPEPLSGFLIQFSLFEAANAAPYTALLRRRPEKLLHSLASTWAAVPLKPAPWYGQSTRFYVAPGLIACVAHDEADRYEITIGAKHRGALRPLRALGLDWHTFDG